MAKIILSNDQKSNFRQLQMTRNENLCEKTLIKQPLEQTQFNQSVQMAQKVETPEVKKQYVSVGVSTDFEMGAESYKQFFKFQVMKTQRFERLQNVFSYIDNICSTDKKKLAERQQKISKLYKTSVKSQQQISVEEILKQKDKIDNQIFQSFNQTIQEFQNIRRKNFLQNMAQIKKIQEEISTVFLEKTQDFVKFQAIGSSVYSIDKNVKRFSSLQNTYLKDKNFDENLNSQLSKVLELVKIFQEKTNNSLNKALDEIVDSIENIESKFKQWKNLISQKNFMLGLCIEDIIKLAEISMIIFGMGDEGDKQNETLKKIGVFLDEIPEFGNFCEKKDMLKSVDKRLNKFLDIKCLNCSYLKSKMRFIYTKNNELQSVIKILNHLIKGQNQSIY